MKIDMTRLFSGIYKVKLTGFLKSSNEIKRKSSYLMGNLCGPTSFRNPCSRG
jgi:hypothetical protein